MEVSNTLFSNFLKRFFTFIVLILFIFNIIFTIGSLSVKYIVSISLVLSLFEFFKLTYKVELYPSGKFLLVLGGVLYLLLSCFSLLLTSTGYTGNINFILILSFACVSDTSGYLIGNCLNGKKIFPRISPGKSYSGSLGSIFFTSFLSATIIFIYNIYYLPFYMLLQRNNYHENNMFLITTKVLFFAGFISVIGQLGDFIQSYVKRMSNVKDSGNIFPGHGGILDRLDSIFTISFFILILDFFGFRFLGPFI